MQHVKETNTETWTRQIWPGNPSLNLVASCKIFSNPFNGKKTPVWIFGGTKEYQGFSFCVNAGASDYSYTGTVGSYEIDKAQTEVDKLYNSKNIFK